MNWEEIETLPRQGLEAIQLRRLQLLVQRVYDRVHPYRAKMDAAGIKPADIRSLADLRHLPYTTKDDLRDNYPFGLFATPMDDVIRVHASSGTTGKSTVVGYTQADITLWASVIARCLMMAGSPGATWCTTPTATACSPVASALTTASRPSAPRSSRCPAAIRSAR